jgi:hypothetical protein
MSALAEDEAMTENHRLPADGDWDEEQYGALPKDDRWLTPSEIREQEKMQSERTARKPGKSDRDDGSSTRQ